MPAIPPFLITAAKWIALTAVPWLLSKIVGGVVNVGGTLGMVLSITMFLLFIRVLFMLIKAYVITLILVILGPVIITFSALPNQEGAVGWLKNLLANLLIFPTTGIVLALGGILSKRISEGADIWGPPLLGSEKDLLAGIVALGILYILPEIEPIIRNALAPKAPALPGLPPEIQDWFSKQTTAGVQSAPQVLRTIGGGIWGKLQKLRKVRGGGGVP